MITDEMRRNAPICQKHGERMTLWLCEPFGYAGDVTISAECFWCTLDRNASLITKGNVNQK